MHQELPWDAAAEQTLQATLEAMPLLTRISAAKRLRDTAESAARRAGEERVTHARVTAASPGGLS